MSIAALGLAKACRLKGAGVYFSVVMYCDNHHVGDFFVYKIYTIICQKDGGVMRYNLCYTLQVVWVFEMFITRMSSFVDI